jgi:putative hydrolase of the HAD superfamily
MGRALLLDVGGVVIRTPFELLAGAERRAGLPARALGPRGPFEPAGDPEFAEVLEGRLAERAYWARRAERAAPLLGTGADTASLMHVLFSAPPDDVLRPETVALMDDARAAGLPVGILTNDLHDFHGPEWMDDLGVFAAVDALVDGSLTGVLKPDPRAYALAIDALGAAAESIVFVDDQPGNVAGGTSAGLRAVHFDVTAPQRSVDEARALLDL